MVESFSIKYGPFCYINNKNFYNLDIEKHKIILERIEQTINNSYEKFIIIYRNKYLDEKYLPFWMVAETVSMGQLSLIFRYLPNDIKVPISKRFNLHSRVLTSWLHALTVIRNITAHHCRLWNIILPVKPAVPKQVFHPSFFSPYEISNTSYIIILAMMVHLMNVIDPNNKLVLNFKRILRKYPGIPIEKMGFPNNWQDCEIFS